MVLTGNSMGIAVKFWDKYHSCCIENVKFPIQHSWYLSQISLLPMLILVQITQAWYTDSMQAINYKASVQHKSWLSQYIYMLIYQVSLQS